jgi:pimeloyl-ACP methyl ester carboxylesterase
VNFVEPVSTRSATALTVPEVDGALTHVGNTPVDCATKIGGVRLQGAPMGQFSVLEVGMRSSSQVILVLLLVLLSLPWSRLGGQEVDNGDADPEATQFGGDVPIAASLSGGTCPVTTWKLSEAANNPGQTTWDVVFVHGWVMEDGYPLNGCSYVERRNPEEDYWDLNGVAPGSYAADLANDIQQAGGRVWTYRWPTQHTMSDAASRLVGLLDSTPSISDHIVLIGHSMGGLVAVKMLVEANSELSRRVARIVTLGTPHSGTNLDFAGIGWLLSESVHHEVLEGSAFLRDLAARRTAMGFNQRIFVAGGWTRPSETGYGAGCGLALVLSRGELPGRDDCVVRLVSAYGTSTIGSKGPGYMRHITVGSSFGFARFDHGRMKLDFNESYDTDEDRRFGRDFYEQVRKRAVDDLVSASLSLSSNALDISSTTSQVVQVSPGGLFGVDGLQASISPASASSWVRASFLEGFAATRSRPAPLTVFALEDSGLSSGEHRATITVRADGVAESASIEVTRFVQSAGGTRLYSPTPIVEPGQEFTVNWLQISGATSYILERTRDGSFSDLQSIVSTQLFHREKIFVDGETRQYRVSGNNSGPSNMVAVRAVAPPPPPPPEASRISTSPSTLRAQGIVGVGSVQMQTVVSVSGLQSFNWRISKRNYGGNGRWINWSSNGGTQTEPVEIRLRPDEVSSPGIYRGELVVTVLEVPGDTAVVELELTVGSEQSSGYDLAIVEARWEDGDAPWDPGIISPTIQWFVKNLGSTQVPRVRLKDKLFISTDPNLDAPELAKMTRVGATSWNFGTSEPLMDPGVIRMLDESLPISVFPFGYSYLYIVTEAGELGDSDFPKGKIPETNDYDVRGSNNIHRIEVYRKPPAILSVSPTALTMNVVKGEVAVDSFSVWNSGEGGMNWSVTVPDFAQALPPSGADSARVRIAIRTDSLASGDHRILFPVNSDAGMDTVWADLRVLLPDPPVAVAFPPKFTVFDESVDALLSAKGGAQPVAWSLLAGALPRGLTLSSGGGIQGRPDSIGMWNASITVTDAFSQSDTIAVKWTIKPRPVGRVTVIPDSVSVGIGDSIRLSADLRDDRGGVFAGVVAWTSLDPEIGSIEETGVVMGGAPGSVRIVASVDGMADTAQVVVRPPLGGFSVAILGDSTVSGNTVGQVHVTGDISGLGTRVAALAGRVSFDPAVIRVDSVTQGSYGGVVGSNLNLQVDSGFVRFAVVNASPPPDLSPQFARIWIAAIGVADQSTSVGVVIEEAIEPNFFVSILSALTSSSLRVVTIGSGGMWGDPNNDRRVSALDALICLSHVVGRDLPSGLDATTCDVAPDGQNLSFTGKATAIDALAILSYVVGNSLPAYFRVGRVR